MRSVFALLWTDSGGLPQCALYDDEEMALTDAVLVEGRVEERTVVAAPAQRAGRFERR